MWVIILSQRYLFVKIKALTKAINYKSLALVAFAMQKKKKKSAKNKNKEHLPGRLVGFCHPEG